MFILMLLFIILILLLIIYYKSKIIDNFNNFRLINLSANDLKNFKYGKVNKLKKDVNLNFKENLEYNYNIIDDNKIDSKLESIQDNKIINTINSKTNYNSNSILNSDKRYIYREIPKNNKNSKPNNEIIRYIKYLDTDSINKEISYDDFSLIIKKVLKEKLYFKNIAIKNIINKIIEKINLYNDFDYNNNKEFKFLYSYHSIIRNTKKILIFNLGINRIFRSYYYILQIIIIKKNNIFLIGNIEIIGISSSQNLHFKNENSNLNLDDYFKKPNIIKFRKQIIDNKTNDFKKYLIEQQAKCFGKNLTTEQSCISYHDGIKGLWDTPCQKNEDCPFFKKNKNYKNNRGRCKNGYCEMPLGVKPFGYKHFKGDPYCYNCKTNNKCIGLECNKCCEDQFDKQIYSNLKSPDYIFNNDTIFRSSIDISSNLLI